MERQVKYQAKILKFLPKAASVVTFNHGLPFSPKRFSSAIRRPQSFNHRRSKSHGQEDQEPTSPKISCMGQIKHANKKITCKVAKEAKPVTCSPRGVKKQASAFKRMLSGAMVVKPGRKSSAGESSTTGADCTGGAHSLPDRAPALSQMRRFASGRDSLAGFDWAQVAPVDAKHRNNIHDFDEFDRDDVMIPFSAPVQILAKKEINIWKRRTMAPPMPLDLNTKMVRTN